MTLSWACVTGRMIGIQAWESFYSQFVIEMVELHRHAVQRQVHRERTFLLAIKQGQAPTLLKDLCLVLFCGL